MSPPAVMQHAVWLYTRYSLGRQLAAGTPRPVYTTSVGRWKAYERHLGPAHRRLALAGTEMARAQCGTIRLKLLKIGAVIGLLVLVSAWFTLFF